MKHHFRELTAYSQGVPLYAGKVFCRPLLRYQHSLLEDPLYTLTLHCYVLVQCHVVNSLSGNRMLAGCSCSAEEAFCVNK